MGRMPLPSISKIEDILDLLTDSDKYIKYIKEFKNVYAETQLALGVLNTKEQADAYLNAAHLKHAESLKFEASVKTKAEAHAAELDAGSVQLHKRAASWEQQFVQEKEALSKRWLEFNKQRACCGDWGQWLFNCVKLSISDYNWHCWRYVSSRLCNWRI